MESTEELEENGMATMEPTMGETSPDRESGEPPIKMPRVKTDRGRGLNRRLGVAQFWGGRYRLR